MLIPQLLELSDLCSELHNLMAFSQHIIKMHLYVLKLFLIFFCSIFCVLFRETRSFVLEESLKKLGVEKLGKEDVQRMQWEVLEAKIGNWIHFMRIAVRALVIEIFLTCYADS